MAQRSGQSDVPNETRESVAEPYRVAVCIPAQDHVATGFAYDLARLFGYTAVAYIPKLISHLHIFTAPGTLIAPQRHELVLRAFEYDCTHILWLDSDMRFPKDTLVRLLQHGKPVVGANYCSCRMPPRPVALSYIAPAGCRDFTNLYTEPDSTGLVTAQALGAGVLLTDINVFHLIEMPWWTIEWCDVDKGYQGEDIHFCKQVRKNGMEVLVDQDLSKEIGHVGTWTWEHGHANEVRQTREENKA